MLAVRELMKLLTQGQRDIDLTVCGFLKFGKTEDSITG
jgi:hypothetical protein